MAQDNVIEAFTALAPYYEDTVDRELRLFWGVGYLEFVQRLLARLAIGAEERVLDVATGTGMVPAAILARTPPLRVHPDHGPVVGLDITPAMLSEARRRLGPTERVQLVCGSGTAMPLAGQVFDVAVCCLGTHHMDVSALLAELSRVLRPGGRLVIADVCATPFWRSLPGRVMFALLLGFYSLWLRIPRRSNGLEAYGVSMDRERARAEIEAFRNYRTAAEWRDLLGQYGFQTVEMSEIHALRRVYPGGILIVSTLERSNV